LFGCSTKKKKKNELTTKKLCKITQKHRKNSAEANIAIPSCCHTCVPVEPDPIDGPGIPPRIDFFFQSVKTGQYKIEAASGLGPLHGAALLRASGPLGGGSREVHALSTWHTTAATMIRARLQQFKRSAA